MRSPSHASLEAKRDAKKLTPAQSDVFLAPRPAVELYDLRGDPHQLTNLVGRPDYNIQRALLSQTLDRWMEETHDSVPEEISHDSFDRETGKALGVKDYRKTTPGEDKGATKVNRPGPR